MPQRFDPPYPKETNDMTNPDDLRAEFDRLAARNREILDHLRAESETNVVVADAVDELLDDLGIA